MTCDVVSLTDMAVRECECCKGSYVRVIESQRFPYGDQQEQVELTAEVPVWRCTSCDDSYTDYEAEEARHAAVCVHLGRLTPSDLVSIRQRHAMSQDAWAAHTHIGLASIKRWESGSLIQGAAHDAYLRLLNDVIGHARHMHIQRELGASGPPVFRHSFTAAERVEARSFQLRLRAN
ncbi:MAG: hypothetical protein EON58_02465 [Alphaproteobacteria bacterium]|nr:MAG: hypothetical protein EON58_02465 [Alphaproteobacteria bacterium]